MEPLEHNWVIDFDARKALVLSMLVGLVGGSDSRAGLGAIYRELELLRPGLLDQAHARLTATRLGLQMRGRATATLPDLFSLDSNGI